MSLEQFRLLYDYSSWANHRVLDACAALAEEQFTCDLRSSFPSVRDTLIHILGGEWIWLERCHGRSPRALPAGWELKTLGDVRTRWAEIERGLAEFVGSLRPADLERVIAYRNIRGNPFAYPLGSILRHLVNHDSYHRGQVTTLLRQLSAAPVATDLILFFRERNGRFASAALEPETVRVLFEYNSWANQRALEASRTLAPEQFTRALGSSFTSVRDTLAHIFGAEWLWLERVRGRSHTALPSAQEFPDLESLRKRWAETGRELLGFVKDLSAENLARVYDYRTTKGAPSANPLWQMLQHVVNHGTYHRGQVTTLLRQLGAQPRATDLLRYFDALAGSPEE